jgi:nucleoid-associated protein YgaU
MAINKAQLASELVGLGTGGGALEKLSIGYMPGIGPEQHVRALFNPSEISISRTINYEQQRAVSKADAVSVRQRFRSVEPATLSIELFFDTYESRDDSATWKRAAVSFLAPVNPFQTGDATDVRNQTSQVAQLAEPDSHTHKPPVCTLRWGTFDIFVGVLTNLDQRFTMFLNDGTPVRATLSCTFAENRSKARSLMGELHSSDVDKTRVVRRHDTLQSIAAQEYGDPAQWRPIAEANGIVNPRVLAPGTRLVIPKLRA